MLEAKVSKVSNARFLLRTSEFRALDPVARAIKLMHEHDVGRPTAAKLCAINENAIRRGIAALADGRLLHVHGRPNLLNEMQTDNFGKLLSERAAENGNEPNYKEAREMVINVNLFLHIFCNVNSIFCKLSCHRAQTCSNKSLDTISLKHCLNFRTAGFEGS